MPRRLFRYVFGRTARSLLVAFLVVTGIIMLVDFVEANRDLGSDIDISPAQLLLLTALETPSLIEQTIPFVVLFGVMGAINGMNRRSELIVMRASGQSAWAILRPALWLAGGLGVLWALVFNPLASRAYDSFEALSAEWLDEGARSTGGEVWLREGREGEKRIIRANGLDLSARTLSDVEVLVMRVDEDGGTAFARRFDARTAKLLSGYWQLEDVVENAPGEPPQRHAAISLPTTIDTETLAKQASGAERTAFWSLPSTISEREAAGFSAQGLRLQFGRLLSLPLMLVAMAFIAAGVSMSLTREGGTLRLLITGVALGFAVFFANSMVGAFGSVAVIPVWLAAWSVPLVVLALGVAHLARIEDG